MSCELLCSDEKSKLIGALIEEVGKAIRYQSLLYHLFSEKNGKVLIQSCPEIWSIIQQSLIDSVISAMGRLCDQERVCGRPQLTVKSVARRLDASDALKNEVSEILKAVGADMEALQSLRHTVVAHPNLDVRMGNTIITMKPNQIDAVLSEMKRAVDLVIEFAGEPPVSWVVFEEVRIKAFMKTLLEGQREIGEIT